jgi:hypothetical protein
MNELESVIIESVLNKYYKKHKKIPKYGRSLVINNLMKPGDMLDYILDIKNGDVYLKYNYYEISSNENKYVTSSIKLFN